VRCATPHVHLPPSDLPRALQVRIQKESEVRLRIVGTRNDANEIVRPNAQSKAARHIRDAFTHIAPFFA